MSELDGKLKKKLKSDIVPSANYILEEMIKLGYIKAIPDSAEALVTSHCIEDLAEILERSSQRAKGDLEKKGYSIKPA